MNIFEHPLYLKQIEIETNNYELGQLKYFEKLEQPGGREHSIPGATAIKQTILPMVEKMKENVELYDAGRASKSSTSIRFYKDLMAMETVAYITAKAIISNIPCKLSKVVNNLKAMLSDEFNALVIGQAPSLNNAYDNNMFLIEYIAKNSKSRTLTRKYMKRLKEDLELQEKTLAKLGFDMTGQTGLCMHLINIFMETTGFAQINQEEYDVLTKRETANMLEPTEEFSRWLAATDARCSLLNPRYPICVIPPKPWTDISGGGYYADKFARLPIMKVPNVNYLQDAMENGALDIDFEVLNMLQETEYVINPTVLSVMKQATEEGLAIGKIPSFRDKIFSPTMTKDEIRQVLEYNKDPARVNLISRARSIMKTAENYSQYDAIYFPVQMDFRGRLYYVPSPLNPQGDDVCKALLTFANGTHLDADAAYWLAVHGASQYGGPQKVDKMSFDDRVKWVHERRELFLETAKNPMDNLWWTEADNPWSFLAFIDEWAGWLTEGTQFVSTLPIFSDGSANGIQWHCGMMLDEKSGPYVNLCDSEKPRDAYGLVAETARRLVNTKGVEHFVPAGIKQKYEDKDRMADYRILLNKVMDFVNTHVNRSFCKRAVMTTPYSVSGYGIRKQFLTDFKDLIIEQIGDKLRFDGASILEKLISESMAEILVGSTKSMEFLKVCAEIVSKHDLAIQWTTPTGLPVSQRYTHVVEQAVESLFAGGVRVKLITHTRNNTLNKKKQANSVSPNFVHSLDSAHMRLTMFRLKEMGLRSFAGIHDSYGVHATNFALMNRVLREEFVKIIQSNPLKTLRDELQEDLDALGIDEQLPEVPELGSFDITQVVDSKYFFAP